MWKYVLIMYILLTEYMAGSEEAVATTCAVTTIGFMCGQLPICDGFHLVGGNLQPGNLVALLGEEHSKKNKTITCLDALTPEAVDHIVYVESVESVKPVTCSDKRIPNQPNRRCIGWEKKAAQRDIADVLAVGAYIRYMDDFLAMYQKVNSNDAEFKKKLNGLIKKMKEMATFPKHKLGNSNPVSIIKASKKILKLKKSNPKDSYKTIIKNYKNKLENPPVGLDTIKQFEKHNDRRDESLQKAIRKHVKEKSGTMGIFIVGREHLTKKVKKTAEAATNGSFSVFRYR